MRSQNTLVITRKDPGGFDTQNFFQDLMDLLSGAINSSGYITELRKISYPPFTPL